MRGLRTTAFTAVIVSLVVTSLSWLGVLWREQGLGLELTVSGSDDERGPWTRTARTVGVGREVLDAAEVPFGAGLHVAWAGAWYLPRSGAVVVRVRAEGDLRVSLDGVAVLVLPNSRDLRRHDAAFRLERGFHDLRVEWFAPRPGSGFRLRWAPAGCAFRELEPEDLLPARPSHVRFALHRLVALGRRLVLPTWGLTLVLACALAARRDLLWDLDDPGKAPGGEAPAAVTALSRPVPWPVAVPAATLAILLPGLLLVLHTAVWRADTDLRHMPASLRYWEELSIASTQYLEDRSPSRFQPASIASWPGASYRLQLGRFVNTQVTRRSLPALGAVEVSGAGPGLQA